MATDNILYRSSYPVNDSISVVIPKVGQILDNEEEYNDAVFLFTSMPIDLMVALDDAGIDFTSINEYDLFLKLFLGLKEREEDDRGIDTSLILGDLDLMDFDLCINRETQKIVLYNEKLDIVIGRKEHSQIAAVLRKINRMEKNRRKPANEDAKKYMLDRARTKMKRRNRKEVSQLEQLIVAMVNTEQFKYDFESVRNLSIYQFNESVRQVIKKINYDNQMYGVYTGTLNPKELSQDDLNWLIHK